ncbi:hypothetical protein BDZ97DRAFT_999066 [Flammula alnicola]|nr:hypothetical protein BDZ97DRAFT_999066 [Flammula alnicola]
MTHSGSHETRSKSKKPQNVQRGRNLQRQEVPPADSDGRLNTRDPSPSHLDSTRRLTRAGRAMIRYCDSDQFTDTELAKIFDTHLKAIKSIKENQYYHRPDNLDEDVQHITRGFKERMKRWSFHRLFSLMRTERQGVK